MGITPIVPPGCRAGHREMPKPCVADYGTAGIYVARIRHFADASSVAAWEVLLAVAVMLVSTFGFVRLGGAVYSGALLRTGARPRLRDVRDAARARG